jgi:hypothetical protein
MWNAGSAAGLPFDLITRYKVSPWGEIGWQRKEPWCAGPTLHFIPNDRASVSIFDLSKPMTVLITRSIRKATLVFSLPSRDNQVQCDRHFCEPVSHPARHGRC